MGSIFDGKSVPSITHWKDIYTLPSGGELNQVQKKISKFSIVFWFTFNVYINYLPFGFNIKIFFMFVSEDCLMYLWEQCVDI